MREITNSIAANANANAAATILMLMELIFLTACPPSPFEKEPASTTMRRPQRQLLPRTLHRTTGRVQQLLSLAVVLLCLISRCQSLDVRSTSSGYARNSDMSRTIRWSPSFVDLRGVSQSYPDTLWRKLTSSVPRREFALDDVSMSIPSSLQLVIGASSSGKSTILRLLAGAETPVAGEVFIGTEIQDVLPARPILLDTKPEFDNRRTLKTILQEAIPKNSQVPSTLCDEVAGEMLEVFGLPAAAVSGETPSSLSPSQAFQFRLAEASLMSIFGGDWRPPIDHDDGMQSDVILPAPILLLDEWMDKETSSVIQKVQTSAQKLANLGGVIISVTHKPEYYRQSAESSMPEAITMCRGSILKGRQGGT